jgi:putative transposase
VDVAVRCRAFQFVLQPTVKQRQVLERLLVEQCRLYNAALEERRGAWRWERRPVTRFEQYRTLTGLCGQEPALMAYGVTVARGTLLRLDRAFQAFFRRTKAGQASGFPRFRSSRRFDSVEYPDGSGWRLNEESRRLYLHGVGHVKVRLHRPLRGVPKTITVRRVGVDVGVTVLAGLSDGRLVDKAPAGDDKPPRGSGRSTAGSVTSAATCSTSCRGRWSTTTT